MPLASFPDDDLTVPEEVWVVESLERFEAESRRGTPPRIEDFVADAQGSVRRHLLFELLRLERELAGDTPLDKDNYLGRFPNDREVVLAALSDSAETRQAITSSPEAKLPADAAVAATKEGVAVRDQFLPGEMLRGRYRIVALLGRGGMGEVYRADDLTLGQPVALKFLPSAAEHDSELLTRLINEVRLARKVSSAHVCRMYDIDEFEGRHFLSMEFVVGEDLASLLRRIGRLPHDKALDVSRQLCLGLAAAHDRGVLHRDLKPSNVMLDDQGRAKIADFGLARIDDPADDDKASCGTPLYMAPEQLLAGETSVRSDVYSLGLVLYELFTGRRAIEADSVETLRRLHTDDELAIAPPSVWLSDLDPAVEDAILRCLHRDPNRRPASSRAVLAALSDDDPLAAAIAAGETPSPELVADSGGEGGLPPRVAACMLAVIAVGLAAVLPLMHQTSATALHGQPLPVSVLRDKAEQIMIQRRGKKSGFSAAGLNYNIDHLAYAGSRADNEVEQNHAVEFWLRESPDPLVASFFRGGSRSFVTDMQVDWRRPPLARSQMTGVRLNGDGQLIEFYYLAPQRRVESIRPKNLTPSADVEPDVWNRLFEQAGFRLTDYQPANPDWLSPVGCDRRLAWMKTSGDGPRIEAASLDGRVVFFRVIDPWTVAERDRPQVGLSGIAPVDAVLEILSLLLLLVSCILAWRNVRAGRGDRRGARRLAAFAFVVSFAACLLGARHVPHVAEVQILVLSLSSSLWKAANFWIGYLALEPFVRRELPRSMISWSRLLAGRPLDPRIGKDVLIGILVGVLDMLLGQLNLALPRWFGLPAPAPLFAKLETHLGSADVLHAVFRDQLTAIYVGLLLIALLFVLLKMLLRRSWLAATVMVLFYTVVLAALYGDPSTHMQMIPILLMINLLIVGTFLRFGVLAMLVGVYVREILNFSTTEPATAWHQDSYLLVLAAVMAAATAAFFVATRRHPLAASYVSTSG